MRKLNKKDIEPYAAPFVALMLVVVALVFASLVAGCGKTEPEINPLDDPANHGHVICRPLNSAEIVYDGPFLYRPNFFGSGTDARFFDETRRRIDLTDVSCIWRFDTPEE